MRKFLRRVHFLGVSMFLNINWIGPCDAQETFTPENKNKSLLWIPIASRIRLRMKNDYFRAISLGVRII